MRDCVCVDEHTCDDGGELMMMTSRCLVGGQRVQMVACGRQHTIALTTEAQVRAARIHLIPVCMAHARTHLDPVYICMCHANGASVRARRYSHGARG